MAQESKCPKTIERWIHERTRHSMGPDKDKPYPCPKPGTGITVDGIYRASGAGPDPIPATVRSSKRSAQLDRAGPGPHWRHMATPQLETTSASETRPGLRTCTRAEDKPLPAPKARPDTVTTLPFAGATAASSSPVW
jgi:hypothetical protein